MFIIIETMLIVWFVSRIDLLTRSSCGFFPTSKVDWLSLMETLNVLRVESLFPLEVSIAITLSSGVMVKVSVHPVTKKMSLPRSFGSS